MNITMHKYNLNDEVYLARSGVTYKFPHNKYCMNVDGPYKIIGIEIYIYIGEEKEVYYKCRDDKERTMGFYEYELYSDYEEVNKICEEFNSKQ